MTICIPTLEDEGLEATASEHFGRAPYYTVYNPDTQSVEVIENDGHHHGGARSPPEIIADTGADTLACSNLGSKAVQRFGQIGTDVYCGATGTVNEVLDQLEDGDLREVGPNDEPCNHEHSEGHGQEHGEGHNHEHGEGHGHEHGEDHDHD